MSYVPPIKNPGISAERLREILRYDPKTGELYWRLRDDVGSWWNGRYAGKEAGAHADKKGYFCISIDNHTYRTHRVIWSYVTGEWPEFEVDHKDTDRKNNRFENLRPATVEQQRHNMSLHKDSETGFKGVSASKNSRYRARIWVGGKEIMLGYRDTAKEAHRLYVDAAAMYFGEFARKG